MTSVMALVIVTSIQPLKDITNTCPTIAEALQCNGGKLEEAAECFAILLICIKQ